MRIRLWNAYSSNNSGSYTLVGSFRSAEEAKAVCDEVASVCQEHGEWVERRDKESHRWDEKFNQDGSPLGRFITDQRLSVDKDEGTGDDWPEYGSQPTVVAVDHQVLLHVDYTITMPRAFGELFYRRGGRVDLELNHSHDAVCTLFTVSMEGRYTSEEMEEKWAQKRAEFLLRLQAGALADVLKWPPSFEKNAVPLYVGEGHHGEVEVGAVFPDVVEGARALRVLVAELGLRVHFRVFEAKRESDPFRALRNKA